MVYPFGNSERTLQVCGHRHMEQKEINFIDYSNCMAKCTPVPVSPWGNGANATQA